MKIFLLYYIVDKYENITLLYIAYKERDIYGLQ